MVKVATAGINCSATYLWETGFPGKAVRRQAHASCSIWSPTLLEQHSRHHEFLASHYLPFLIVTLSSVWLEKGWIPVVLKPISNTGEGKRNSNSFSFHRCIFLPFQERNQAFQAASTNIKWLKTNQHCLQLQYQWCNCHLRGFGVLV